MHGGPNCPERPGFFFCISPDGRLVKNEVDRWLAACPPPTPPGAGANPGWQKHTFWGDEELPSAFWESLTLQGLFATPRALVIRNAHNLPADTWKRLNLALAKADPLAWPFLCLEGSWEKGQPKIPAHLKKIKCLAHAQSMKWVWRSPGLDARGAQHHAAEVAKRLGLRFENGVLAALCAVMPQDAAVVESELEKLSLLAGDMPVTSAMASLAEYGPSFDIFGLIRHIQSGNATQAWKTVLDENSQGEELIFPLLGLLQREARLLWQLRAGENPYLHPSSASNKREAASRLGYTGLANVWDALHTAELAIKSGSRSPSQALDALLASLTRIFGAVRT